MRSDYTARQALAGAVVYVLVIVAGGVALGTVATSSACAPKHPNVVTPQGQRAYTADQVVLRVNELQAATINAQASGGVSTAVARELITWCVKTNMILKATPGGWQTTIQASWTEVKKTVGVPANPVVSAAMSAVDALLETLE